MKKAIILLLVTVAVSYGKEDIGQDSSGITPPEWIRGVWTANVLQYNTLAMEFTNNNLLEGVTSQYGISVTNDYGQIFDGEQASWSDRWGNDVYYIDMVVTARGEERTFEFHRNSDTQLLMKGYGLGLEITLEKID